MLPMTSTRTTTSLNVTKADGAAFNLLLAQLRADGYQGRQAELFREMLTAYQATRG
jgi:hypothetical protein